MKHRTIIIILSVLIVVSSIVIPMLNIWPEGIIPDEDAWTTLDTLEVLFDEDEEAFRYIGVAFHFAAWIPAIFLCFAAFFTSDIIVVLASLGGTCSMAGVLLFTIINENEPEIINLEDGHICFEYWLVLILFVLCALAALIDCKGED